MRRGQRREEGLWKRFLVEGRVDRVTALRYLKLMSDRHSGSVSSRRAIEEKRDHGCQTYTRSPLANARRGLTTRIRLTWAANSSACQVAPPSAVR